MQGWRKIMSLGDNYKAEIKRLQLIKNGIEAMVMNKAKDQIKVAIGGADLYVKEGQYEIATILLFENEEDY
ncbi:MAG: hypothetical protein M3Q56_05300 [Bacteroidota bacterium]|nr:hypothetical protein [Bacteroidota bacterium]